MLIANTIQRSDLREKLTIGGTETVTDIGGGAVTVEITGGDEIFARARPMKGREYFQARQVVGGTPFEVIIEFPLPEDVTLTAADSVVWHSELGDVTLHLTSPPSLMLGNRFLMFMAVVKE